MNIPYTYKPFISLVFLFAAICVLNIPILNTLWLHSFDDGTYSHAYLIPFITLYLYFKLSEVGLLVFRDKVALTPLFMLLVSGILLFVTSNAQISIGYWLSLLAVMLSGVITLFRFNWYIVFPTAFLIFIFPLWGALTDLLQHISVVAVTYMMSFTGIPTYVEAEFITIPAGMFEIADGCSGLRYIIVSLAISSLFIFLYINNAKKAILFLSLAILGALITNWIRITALILIGEYTQMQSSLMEDHNTFGWYLYIPFMFLLFVWGNKLSTTDLLNEKPVADQKQIAPAKPSMIFALISFVVFSTSIKSYLSNDIDNTQEITHANLIKPEIVNPSSSTVSPSSFNKEVSVYTYHFNGAHLEGKPTHFNNNLVPTGWKKRSQDIIGNWNVNIISKRRQKALVLFQYEIANEKIATVKQFKITRLLKGLEGEYRTKLHWIYMPCKLDCEAELKNRSVFNPT